MSKSETILSAGFALFSIVTSFMFVFYGVNGISSELASSHLRLFAYVTAGYGLMNIYILSIAWRNRASWTDMANRLISFCFIGVLIMDMLKFGADGGRNYVAVPVVTVVLLINWLAVRKAAARPQ